MRKKESSSVPGKPLGSEKYEEPPFMKISFLSFESWITQIT
jgi:hypothetical protein